MNHRTLLGFIAAIVLAFAPSAQALELIAWSGAKVDSLTPSPTTVTPSSAVFEVDTGSSDAQINTLVAIDSGTHEATFSNLLTDDGYVEFVITTKAGQEVTVESFELKTTLVGVSALTRLTGSSNGTTFTTLDSQTIGLSITPTTQTFTLPTAVTISNATPYYFRLESASLAFTYSASQPAVFAFYGVPEPTTIVMSATGVAVLACTGIARRRRKQAGQRLEG